MDDAARQLATFGRTLVQVNLRLSRLTELIEGGAAEGGGAASDAAALELALDLLDAVERTVAPPSAPAPAVPWIPRWLGVRPPPPPDWSGLRLARDQARHRLERLGWQQTPVDGPVNFDLHEVIETAEACDAAPEGTIARTHRSGWYRPGEPPKVLRLAQVTVFRRRT